MTRSMKQGLRLAALVAAAVVAAGHLSAQAGNFDGREAVVWSPGGKYATAIREAYADPFEKETGAKIRIVEGNIDEALGTLSAQVKAGKVEWDGLSSVDAPWLPKVIDEGLIQKVDSAQMPRINELPKSSLNEYGVAVLSSAVIASYRDAQGVTPLKSVKDFFDPNIKGARSMASLAAEAPLICILALSSDGVSFDELIKGIDVERCLKIVGRIKDQVTVYWSTGSAMAQQQVDEEVDYCLCWDGRSIQAALANPKWHIAYKDGIQFYTYFVYAKGTKNADVLDSFVAYMLEPKLQAKFTEQVGYMASNPGALEYLPDKLKPLVSATPEAQAGLITVPQDLNLTVGKQQAAIGEAWLAFISK